MEDGKGIAAATLAAAVGGDAGALAEVVELARAVAVRVAVRRLSAAEDVEDVGQEVAILALRKLGAVRDPERFAGWVRAATMTTIADMRRTFARTGARPVEVLDGAEPVEPDYRGVPGVDPGPAVRALPAKLRADVIAHYFHGMTIREVADARGARIGAVRLNLKRARRRMAAAVAAGATLTREPAAVEVRA